MPLRQPTDDAGDFADFSAVNADGDIVEAMLPAMEIAEADRVTVQSAEKLDLTGWLLVWKPQGITSFDVIRWLRRGLTGLRPRPKIGHTGTLDPFAEGLLLVALGGATRLIPLLEDWNKRYQVVCELGRETTTLDPEGTTVAEAPVPALTQSLVEAALPPFLGSIWQTPPVFSALKQGGEALYRKARRGETVEVQPRLVHIDHIQLTSVDGETIAFEMECGSGTYVRSLCRDLAKALGTVGHCRALARTALGSLSADAAWHLSSPKEVSLEELQVRLQPADWPLEETAWISVGCSDASAFAHGNHFSADGFENGAPEGVQAGQALRVYDATGQFLGIAELRTATSPYQFQPRVVLVTPID
ncbi:MAG: tRNA pseudouridine synthase B [bacterium]|nr:tRNA pseudouridine synthase B [bacterium]